MVFSFNASEVRAESGYYSSNCGGCHTGVSSTCNGCHGHGVHSSTAQSDINLKGATGKSSYAPGETVAVSISGGYRNGWVRAILFDQNMKEVARSTGPNGKGGGASFPITLSAPAPTTPGTYTWNVAWYGHKYDLTETGGRTVFGARWTPDAGNSNHGMEIVSTNQFTVTGTAVPDVNLNPASLSFGTVTIGGSTALTSQVQNLGNASLNVTAINRCAGTSGEYTWSPAAPFAVAAGGNQTLTVTYKPLDTVADAGCLQIVSNDTATPTATLNLSGTGSQPTVQLLDLDIAGLTATRRVSLSRGKTVQVKLTVANPGPMTGSADATLVGVQNGAQVYNETIAVSAAVGGTASATFPAYLPTALGTITWTVTLADQDPDTDTATATSSIVK
jgi:hypothetical protein